MLYVGVWLVVGRVNGLAIRALGGAIFRPLVATIGMTIVLLAMPALSPSPLIELALRMTIGATVYCCILAMTWLAIGKPNSIERRIVDYLHGLARASR